MRRERKALRVYRCRVKPRAKAGIFYVHAQRENFIIHRGREGLLNRGDLSIYVEKDDLLMHGELKELVYVRKEGNSTHLCWAS